MYKCIVSSVTESRSLPTRRQKKSINHNFPYAYVNLLLIKKKKKEEEEVIKWNFLMIERCARREKRGREKKKTRKKEVEKWASTFSHHVSFTQRKHSYRSYALTYINK